MACSRAIVTGLSACLLSASAGSAHAAFTALLGIECKPPTANPNNAAKKGLTTTINTGGGDPNTDPYMVKAIRGIISVRPVSNTTAGVQVTKGQLTNQEAYGAGSPQSDGPPSYAGPYTGMMWPYRDVYDRNANSIRNANQVGQVFDQATQFLIADPVNLGSTTVPGPMLGYAIGGPTESLFTSADMSVNRLFRGVPGNGVVPVLGTTAGAGWFNFDIDVGTLGPQDFDISILSGEIDLVIQDRTSGVFRQITVAIDPAAVRVTIPAPAGVALLAPLGLVAARRRR